MSETAILTIFLVRTHVRTLLDSLDVSYLGHMRTSSGSHSIISYPPAASPFESICVLKCVGLHRYDAHLKYLSESQCCAFRVYNTQQRSLCPGVVSRGTYWFLNKRGSNAKIGSANKNVTDTATLLGDEINIR